MIRKNIDVSLGEDGARPIAMLVQLASQYVSNIEIHRDTMTVNAKSIMGMMTLGLAKGQKLELLIGRGRRRDCYERDGELPDRKLADKK